MLNNLQTMPAYICPLCKTSLEQKASNNKVMVCSNNHCFDYAKEGYLNLLPVQFKHSKNPGDNKAMVTARREFLEKGYYQPLINKLVQYQKQYALPTANVLDAGCGEGYYTHQHKQADNQVYGVDIAKEAIKKAAKKYQACHFSVASLFQLPFADHHFAWIVSIYAPILASEFSRVLAQSGYLITVTPAEDHLLALRELLYQEVREHDTTSPEIEGFTLVEQERLSYPMCLATGQDALNLLSMTPFAYKATEQVLAQLKNTVEMNCQADFLIRLYQKSA